MADLIKLIFCETSFEDRVDLYPVGESVPMDTSMLLSLPFSQNHCFDNSSLHPVSHGMFGLPSLNYVTRLTAYVLEGGRDGERD